MMRCGSQAALLVILGLAAWACRNGTAAGRDPRTPGLLVQEPCPPSLRPHARCSTLFVHENRSTGRGRVIPLRIVVRPTRGDGRAAGPIFFLAGGPGQAATELIQGPALVEENLRDRHDLVYVDQRGTGGSNALTCEFYGPPWNMQSYFEPFLPISRVRECRDKLSAKADLAQYTTAISVDDMEDVRRALGYERINVVGGSYGTRLAMEYVRHYEPRVRSVILEGVATTFTHMPENFGLVAQQALDGLLDECLSTPECARAFPSIRENARMVFARLREAPVRVKVTYPGSGQMAEVLVTKEHVAETIRYMMYSSYGAVRVPLALHAAYQGDYSPIAESLLRRRASGTFDGLYLSITCAEDVPFVSADAEEREAATYMAGYRVREQRAACAEWPRGAAPDWVGRPVTVKVPVFIISGALDPATPPANGLAVAKTLPNSLHVTIPFGGHSPAGLNGLECLHELKAAFIERGSVEGLDVSCISRIRRPSFATSGSR